MPDVINQRVVTLSPQIQANLNTTRSVRTFWKKHRLASQQAFLEGNPFSHPVLEKDITQILPWMPDWIGNKSTKTGILVVGSSYAPVVRPEPINKRGFRRCSPTAAAFKRLCANGDMGHRQLYEDYFWREDDAYYGNIEKLFDALFPKSSGKECIVLTDVVRASLVEVTDGGVKSKEFSRDDRLKLFGKYLDPRFSRVADGLNVVARIDQLLVKRDRVAVIGLGWFAEYLVAAFMKERNGWTRLSPSKDKAMPRLCLSRVRRGESLGYASGRNLDKWLKLNRGRLDCWRWHHEDSKKEVWMMPIYHPSKPHFADRRKKIIKSLRRFLEKAGCSPI